MQGPTSVFIPGMQGNPEGRGTRISPASLVGHSLFSLSFTFLSSTFYFLPFYFLPVRTRPTHITFKRHRNAHSQGSRDLGSRSVGVCTHPSPCLGPLRRALLSSDCHWLRPASLLRHRFDSGDTLVTLWLLIIIIAIGMRLDGRVGPTNGKAKYPGVPLRN